MRSKYLAFDIETATVIPETTELEILPPAWNRLCGNSLERHG